MVHQRDPLRRCLVALAVATGCGAATHEPDPIAHRAAPPPCPEDMTFTGTGCIDRWEGSLVLVTPEGDKPFSPYEQVRKRNVRAVSRPGVVPQGYISELEADAACRASGKRICKADEWVKACMGPRGTTFPYGEERKAGVCNGESTIAPLSFLPPNQRFGDMINMNHPLLNQLPHTVAKTGEYAQCTNGYGVFDMVGNLHEWVAEAWFLGGYYRDTAINGDGCHYVTKAHAEWYHDYSTGFRCCKDPAR